MLGQNRMLRRGLVLAGLGSLLGAGLLFGVHGMSESKAAPFSQWFHFHRKADQKCCPQEDHAERGELEGTWYWLRSPEEEKRVVASLFNTYCIRCHGPDGRGIWDIPGVPDFTNARWQASRSDGDIARIIVEGRGAVMPPFRGTLSLEEAWGMARHLRSFLPGMEASKPDFGSPKK
jgi:mono/diheme cytochrome c family protein